MTISRKTLCVVYALIGLAALVGTWGNNLNYLGLGFTNANVRFWLDTLANPASRSITVDVFFFALAATVWLLLEARRLGMRGAWWYVLLSLLVAVSFAFPMFLIHRERTLAKLDAAAPAGSLKPADVAGLLALALLCLAYAGVSLT
jgi:hypothetical protein